MVLCNFLNTKNQLNRYGGKWKNLVDSLDARIDGIELLLHGNLDVSTLPKKLVKGLHLSYYPTWLEAYKKDQNFKEAMLETYRKEIEVAKELEVHYMVFHVAHVTIEDAFRFKYSYTNLEVIESVIDLVNQLLEEDLGITLLFENLWWPGLTLLNKEELDYLMAGINYKNSGVMLDLSHLLITNKKIKTLEESTAYILETVKQLGHASKYIQGLHINYTEAGTYLSDDHKALYKAYLKEGAMGIVYKHISKLDSHKPYKTHGLKKIIELIQPKYQVIEVIGATREAWEGYVLEQLNYM